jgi:hypothetical protein
LSVFRVMRDSLNEQERWAEYHVLSGPDGHLREVAVGARPDYPRNRAAGPSDPSLRGWL